jgi:cell division protein FtsB
MSTKKTKKELMIDLLEDVIALVDALDFELMIANDKIKELEADNKSMVGEIDRLQDELEEYKNSQDLPDHYCPLH